MTPCILCYETAMLLCNDKKQFMRDEKRASTFTLLYVSIRLNPFLDWLMERRHFYILRPKCCFTTRNSQFLLLLEMFLKRKKVTFLQSFFPSLLSCFMQVCSEKTRQSHLTRFEFLNKAQLYLRLQSNCPVAEIQFKRWRGKASRISDKFVLIFHSFWFF